MHARTHTHTHAQSHSYFPLQLQLGDSREVPHVNIVRKLRHSCEDGLVWFGLCCLMTPGLRKDIRCHV